MPIILVNERNCISFPAYVITSFAPAEPPFDKIKLDQSSITEVETNPQSKAIIRAVLALGNSLQVPILAEGADTEGQPSLLGVEGCDEAQGYLLGWPAPLSQMAASGRITSAAKPSQV